MRNILFVFFASAALLLLLISLAPKTSNALWLDASSTVAEPYTINRLTKPQVHHKNQEYQPDYTVEIQGANNQWEDYTDYATMTADGVFIIRGGDPYYSFDGNRAYRLLSMNNRTVHPHPASADLFATRTGGGEQELYVYRNFESLLNPIPINTSLFFAPENNEEHFPDTSTRIRTNSLSISSNGQWLTAQARSSTIMQAMIMQANTTTGETRYFAQGFSYQSNNQNVRTMSSSTGRYVVVGSGVEPRLELYDMSTCKKNTSNIYDCEKIDLAGHINEHYPTIDRTNYVRFRGEHTLELSFHFNDGSEYQKKTILLSPEGYQPTHMGYLGMGDSFTSGEGAYDYTAASNTYDNRCHVSTAAYPHRLGELLNLDEYNSVACSGATTNDIGGKQLNINYFGQSSPMIKQKDRQDDGTFEDILGEFKPGYIEQANFNREYKPRHITISIGGNDIGFTDILKACDGTASNCFDTYEERYKLLESINAQYNNLIRTYTTLRNQGDPDSNVYVIGYPSVVSEDNECHASVGLSHDERIFVNQLTHHINSVIERAAQAAGVHYIDTFDTLAGDRLCEGDERAVHNVVINRGTDVTLLGSRIAHESYHPTAFGHNLLLDRIADASDNFNKPQPVPELNIFPPTISNNAPMLADRLDDPDVLPPSGIRRYDHSITPPVFELDESVDVSVDAGGDHHLKPSETYEIWLHPELPPLKTTEADENGTIDTTIGIPSSVAAGYYTVKITGTNIFDDEVSIERIVYIADPAVLADEQHIIDEVIDEESAESDEVIDEESAESDKTEGDETSSQHGDAPSNHPTDAHQQENTTQGAGPANGNTQTSTDDRAIVATVNPQSPAVNTSQTSNTEPIIQAATETIYAPGDTPQRSRSQDPQVAGTYDVAATELSDERSSDTDISLRSFVVALGGIAVAILLVVALYFVMKRLLRR